MGRAPAPGSRNPRGHLRILSNTPFKLLSIKEEFLLSESASELSFVIWELNGFPLQSSESYSNALPPSAGGKLWSRPGAETFWKEEGPVNIKTGERGSHKKRFMKGCADERGEVWIYCMSGKLREEAGKNHELDFR